MQDLLKIVIDAAEKAKTNTIKISDNCDFKSNKRNLFDADLFIEELKKHLT